MRIGSPKKSDPRWLLAFGLIFFGLATHSEKVTAADKFQSSVEGSLMFHTGSSTGSLTGANSYLLALGSKSRTGFFRSHVSALLQFSSGSASISSSTSSYTLYGGVLAPGFSIYPSGKGGLQPFLSGSGLIGSHLLKLSSAPSGVEKNTIGLSYGYEVGAGVDLRLGKGKKFLRITTHFTFLSSSLAGQSGFTLGGFRMGLGLTY